MKRTLLVARPTLHSYIAAYALSVNVAACAGGQSGNEGEMPMLPCPNDDALVAGKISALEEGCVTLDVLRLVKPGLPITDSHGRELFSGTADTGDDLRGKLGQVYSYSHNFVDGETVVAWPNSWDDHLELQLMPLHGEEVDLQWGSASFRATLDELTAPGCQATIRARAESARLDQSAARSGTVQAEPAAVHPVCGN